MKARTLYPLHTWLFWVIGVPVALIVLFLIAAAATELGSLPFDNPDLWWLLLLPPAAGLLCLYGRYRKAGALRRFSSKELAPLLVSNMASVRPALRAGLIVIALACTAAAIIGPRWGLYMEKQTVRGVDIVVALDVSNSMLADDLRPSRLERAKQEIIQQLAGRDVFQRSSRLALIAFAGSTSLKVPLTTDHLNFRTKLEQIRVGSAPRGGTAIAEAIRASADLLTRSAIDATKIILIVTDGEDHEGGPVEVAREVHDEHGILIHAVGVGDPTRTAGAQVPAGAGNERKPMLHQGQIVFSKLNVAGLREIAETGHGRYVPIEDLYSLVNSIASMDQTELTTEERRRHKPRYQWFIAASLLMLGLETLLSERRTGRATLPRRTWQSGDTP